MATKPELPADAPQLDPKTGEFRVIAPGYTFKSVTNVISRIVLTPHTPLFWLFGFTLAGSLCIMLFTCRTVLNL
jgi:hypothetical protein